MHCLRLFLWWLHVHVVADPDLQLRRGGGQSSRPWDTGWDSSLQKKFCLDLQVSVWSKNKGGGGAQAPPLDPLLAWHDFWLWYKHLYCNLRYCISSINCPGRLLNFQTLKVGAYSRGALIRGWALIEFSPFLTSVVCIFCKKTVNGNNKTRRCNKARFLQNTLKKTPSSGKSQISTYSFFGVVAGREVGAYSRLNT